MGYKKNWIILIITCSPNPSLFVARVLQSVSPYYEEEHSNTKLLPAVQELPSSGIGNQKPAEMRIPSYGLGITGHLQVFFIVQKMSHLPSPLHFFYSTYFSPSQDFPSYLCIMCVSVFYNNCTIVQLEQNLQTDLQSITQYLTMQNIPLFPSYFCVMLDTDLMDIGKCQIGKGKQINRQVDRKINIYRQITTWQINLLREHAQLAGLAHCPSSLVCFGFHFYSPDETVCFAIYY